MKKIICTLLAVTMLAGCMLLTSCKSDTNSPSNDETEATAKKLSDIDLHDIVDAVNEALPFDGLISDYCYKDTDVDEMILWTYGLYEASCQEKVKDYAITLPSDYNQTLAVIVFDDTVTDEDIAEVKEVVTKEYIKVRASALQMYMPEQYDIVKWQMENPDAIWRQYDNTLVLLMYNDSEATEGWEAIDALLK